jgi:hypothetical protein
MLGACHGRTPGGGLTDPARAGSCQMMAVVIDGGTGSGCQEFQDLLVDVGGTLHHQEVPDPVDQLRV